MVNHFRVHFWGVRGSVACPGPENVRYGGNTSCVEVRCGEQILIFDAGTGLRNLAKNLQPSRDLNLDLFLTHTHFDHVCGFPFFDPAFRPETHLKIWAGHLLPEQNIREVLDDMMKVPLWPVQLEHMSGNIKFHDFTAGDVLAPKDGIVVRTGPLNHTNRATGYRVEYCGRSVCYITDTEHKPDIIDQNIKRLVSGADVVIYDACFTDENYANYTGWGHSTWQEGVKLCDAASVNKLIIFHHDPGNDDSAMDIISKNVGMARPGSVVAMEGMELEV